MKKKEGKCVEELQKEITRLKKELKRKKKYGLVWEEKSEDVVEMCKEKLPILKEVNDKEIITDENLPVNILIEGDNYHALSALNYTHAGKIDVIYIDPPYNTGAKDWKYNNDYVDSNDAFRHSKWICMMEKRLKLAKKLLKKSGLLICTIDKNEQATLGLLLNILYSDKEIIMITIIHNPAGVQGKNFSHTNEFAYFVFPKNGKYISNTSRDKDLVSPMRDWGTVSKRSQAKTCFYPIVTLDNEIIEFGDVCKDSFHPKSSNISNDDGSVTIYPIDKNGIERKWVFSRNSIEKIKNELFCKIVDNEVVVMRSKGSFTYRTVWDNKRYYANIHGSKLLNNIISTKFPFPKSLYAVEDCIKATIHPKDAIILDFFAGSGTTGHAILKMNNEDNGCRRFILVTNNENNICDDVCYPRLKKVIKGYKGIKDSKAYNGLNGNLKYFKADFVEAKPTDKNKKKLTEESTEMLCIKEDTFDEVKTKNKSFRVFKNGKKYTGIIYDVIAINDFKDFCKKIDGKFSVYVFSLSDDTYDEEFSDMKNKVKLSPIPEAILRVYRRLFK